MPLSPDLNTNTLMCFSASSFIHLSMYVEENIPFNKSYQSVSISNVDLDDLIWWLCILPCSIYILTFIKTAQVFMSTPCLTNMREGSIYKAWHLYEEICSNINYDSRTEHSHHKYEWATHLYWLHFYGWQAEYQRVINQHQVSDYTLYLHRTLWNIDATIILQSAL